jgi:hypothetical protein
MSGGSLFQSSALIGEIGASDPGAALGALSYLDRLATDRLDALAAIAAPGAPLANSYFGRFIAGTQVAHYYDSALVNVASGNGVFGAYVTLIDPTSVTSKILSLCHELVALASGEPWDIKIALGAAGAEVDFYYNISNTNLTTNTGFPFTACLPMIIPAGSRISASCKSTGLATNVGFFVSIGG